MAVVGAGKRDLPYDAGLPVFLSARTADGAPKEGATAVVRNLFDHHAVLTGVSGLDVTDVVDFGISHPCSAFDRWPEYVVTDGNGQAIDVWHTDFHRSSLATGSATGQSPEQEEPDGLDRGLPPAGPVPDDEVGEPVRPGAACDPGGRIPDRLQVSGRHRKRRFIRVPGRAERKVPERPGRHFDVGAEHHADRMRGAEIAEGAERFLEGRKVLHIEPARIDRVSGEQHARGLVVDGDGGRMVPRRRDHFKHPAAKVHARRAPGPVADPEERGNLFGGMSHDAGVGPVRELPVRGDVVPVGVRVGDDEFVTVPGDGRGASPQ